MMNISILRFQSLFPLVLLTALAAGIGLLMAGGDYEWQGLLLVTAGIGILAALLVPRLARLEAGGFLLKVLVWGLLLKIVFSVIHFWFDFGVYGGTADASLYLRTGSIIAQHIWRLEFAQVIPYIRWGTDFVSFFTGVVNAIIGATRFGSYFVFAFLAFLGSYFYYRAFRVAFPHGNERLYAILVFFYPSLLLLSNGVGKDALIALFIGLFAYGGAQLSYSQFKGSIPLVTGLLGVMWIRPHIAALLAIALLVALLTRGVGKGAARPAFFLVGLLAAGGLAWFLLPRIMVYVGLNELSSEGVLGMLQRQQGFTFEGGSAFQNVDISNPLAFPMAFVNLFFRPFPWEANNLQAMVQSIETVVFMGLVLWRIKSLGRAIASSISNAYVRFILIYIIVFAIAFISIQNFGILVRQRTMMLPLFFMLISYVPLHALNKGKAKEVTI